MTSWLYALSQSSCYIIKLYMMFVIKICMSQFYFRILKLINFGNKFKDDMSYFRQFNEISAKNLAKSVILFDDF
jgi:hypothetical protein